MTVKAQNKVNREDIKALINCNSAKLKFMLILLFGTFTAFLIFCMISNNTGNNFGYSLAGILWCVIVYCYVFLINPALVYRSFRRRYSEEAVISYCFSEKKLTLKLANGNGHLDKKRNFADMFKIYETDDHFFFYFKRNEAYIMRKSGITEGSAGEISEVILKEAGQKFIRKVRNK